MKKEYNILIEWNNHKGYSSLWHRTNTTIEEALVKLVEARKVWASKGEKVFICSPRRAERLVGKKYG